MKGTSNWHSLNKDEVEKILNSNLLHGLSNILFSTYDNFKVLVN
ncbi:MAG: hypothetical protein NZ922_02290 [Candidatus Methanomethyliaceae archaeon]|nr:hypothetical protein [Candidatus Methanomethyliaceae archaeon]